MGTSKRDSGIDFLRAASILYIVGYWHLLPYTQALPGYANLYTESLKYIALATFVFCSGFLLARRPVSLGLADLRSFYSRRLLRIYPLYLLALVLFLVAAIAPAAQLLDGALLISMFQPPPLPTLWFITMLMLFYVVAPLLIRTADQGAWILLPAIGLFGAMVAVHQWLHPIDLRLLFYWPIFVIAILYQRRPRLRGWLEQRGLLLLLLLVPALLICRGANEWSMLGIARAFPIALVGTLVWFVYAPSIARPLHVPTIAFLAYTGFGLYLFHRVVFKAAIALYFPEDGWNQVLYLSLLIMPLTILIAYLIQSGYDRGLSTWGPGGADGRGA